MNPSVPSIVIVPRDPTLDIVPVISAEVENSFPARVTLNGLDVEFGSVPPAQKTEWVKLFPGLLIPARLLVKDELDTVIYPLVESRVILPFPEIDVF